MDSVKKLKKIKEDIKNPKLKSIIEDKIEKIKGDKIYK